MSFSKPKVVNRNPAVKFIQWRGASDKGYFEYYDKEKKENIQIDLSKGFIVLDSDLFAITGFRNSDESTIISNEVRTVDDTLIVKAWKNKKSEVLLQGPYSKLKETVKASNQYKYTRCIYAMLDGELVHISLTGNGVFEFGNGTSNGGNFNNNIVIVTEVADGKNGAVKYKYPKFGFGREIDHDEANKAYEIDANILQPYLESYLKSDKTKDDDNVSQEPDEFNPNNWREFQVKGTRLCEYSFEQIKELQEYLVEHNDTEGDAYACVAQAIYDWNQANSQWESLKDKQGKPISEYSSSSLLAILNKTPKDHPERLKLHCAYEAILAMETCDDEDIPF